MKLLTIPNKGSTAITFFYDRDLRWGHAHFKQQVWSWREPDVPLLLDREGRQQLRVATRTTS